MNFPGVIGTGAKALNWYLKTIQDIGEKQFGNNYVVPVKVIGVPFKPINHILPHKMKEAGNLMVPYFKEMEEINDTSYILANITLHEAMENVSTMFDPSSNYISLRTILRNQKERLKGSEIMIIGSRYTMESNYIPSILACFIENFTIVKPSDELAQEIDKLRTLYYKKSNPDRVNDCFGKLLKSHPKATFMIACTEHAIALDDFSDKSRFLNLPKEQCKEVLKHVVQ